jgi:hypothetical protein
MRTTFRTEAEAGSASPVGLGITEAIEKPSRRGRGLRACCDRPRKRVMIGVFTALIRLLWPLTLAAPLLAGCAGGYPPPGPPVYPPAATYYPSYRPVPPYRAGDFVLSAPDIAGFSPATAPAPVKSPDLSPPPPFVPPPPIADPPAKEPAPAPQANIDARPPGTRCGWWELCNLWEN